MLENVSGIASVTKSGEGENVLSVVMKQLNEIEGAMSGSTSTWRLMFCHHCAHEFILLAPEAAT